MPACNLRPLMMTYLERFIEIQCKNFWPTVNGRIERKCHTLFEQEIFFVTLVSACTLNEFADALVWNKMEQEQGKLGRESVFVRMASTGQLLIASVSNCECEVRRNMEGAREADP